MAYEDYTEVILLTDILVKPKLIEAVLVKKISSVVSEEVGKCKMTKTREFFRACD